MTIPVPSFNEYENVLRPGQLDRVALDPVTFELDLDAFADSAVRVGSNVAVLVTPNNPTALSVDRVSILALADRLAEHGCRLIVDESFIEFSREGRTASVEGDVQAHPNLVVIKSMSKVFGIAGLRIGYLLTADREFAETVRSYLPIWNLNGIAESFLRRVGRYQGEFAASCQNVRDTCQEFYRAMCGLPGLAPFRPDANFVFCKITAPDVTGPELTRRLYAEYGILIKGLRDQNYAGGRPLPADRLSHQRRERSPDRRAGPTRTGPDLSTAPVADRREEVAPSPSILSHLADAANLLTLAGVAVSIVAIILAVRGSIHGAAICLVGAFIFDVIDGPVAKRTTGRTTEQGEFGANLDSLADMVSAGVTIGVVIVCCGHFEVEYMPVAVLLAAATALRLSYFNVHGMEDLSGTYTGLPTDLAILCFVGLLLLEGVLASAAFHATVALGGVALAGLMVSPLRVPKLTGRPFVAILVVAVAIAAAHAARLLT
ncbi:MAG: aminotransferase class I/II-fold pyridoxal phosphate-dependent enzyme [Acidimicrobiales bacterium]